MPVGSYRCFEYPATRALARTLKKFCNDNLARFKQFLKPATEWPQHGFLSPLTA
jgi:hypothetical protein